MGANQNKKISVFGGQFEPDFTGQFGPDLGGQFNSDFGGQYDWFFHHTSLEVKGNLSIPSLAKFIFTGNGYFLFNPSGSSPSYITQ